MRVVGVEVVVPLRWDGADTAEHRARVVELSAYLRRLSQVADVTVVDGSGAERFAAHARVLGDVVRHVPPRRRTGANGKVDGAVTGIAIARHERVVVADDDVRYTGETLDAVAGLLDEGHLVRPQNVFTQWPWHARWDGARSMLNRAVGADWPGTFGVRRSTMQTTGGWDADVMFENLELVRTVRAAGGRVVEAPHVLVGRLPPSAWHFCSQRMRQAYDDQAQPWRLAGALATVPAVVLTARRAPRLLPVAALALVLLAEVGRRRAGCRSAVPGTVPLWAPVWVLERGVCSWLALIARARGGAWYHGTRVRTAAHSTRWIRRRLLVPSGADPSSGAQVGRAVEVQHRAGRPLRLR